MPVPTGARPRRLTSPMLAVCVGGAVWPVPSFLASRRAALAHPQTRGRAARELGAVLRQLAAAAGRAS